MVFKYCFTETNVAIFWRRRSRRKKIDKNRNATQEHVGFCKKQ